jgi:hypothetical protein
VRLPMRSTESPARQTSVVTAGRGAMI